MNDYQRDRWQSFPDGWGWDPFAKKRSPIDPKERERRNSRRKMAEASRKKNRRK